MGETKMKTKMKTKMTTRTNTSSGQDLVFSFVCLQDDGLEYCLLEPAENVTTTLDWHCTMHARRCDDETLII